MANSISIGVAYKDPAIVGGTVDNTPIGATTPAAATFTALTGTGAASIVGSATTNLAFHGVAGTARAAIATALVTAVTAGAASTADYATLVTTVNAIRTLLINKGLMASS